ncbi:spore germination lipoprotein GerD [Heyndrickxia sporothermodurans]|uniref:spore germination lipoprotein GerD n=1 Tax=Heyndrickxia sporothermodurans TaxID=46224 RepID=UPI0035E35334
MKKIVVLLLFSIFLSACSSNPSTEKMDYDQTKKMIVDILKTDEGKKAIQDIMTDKKMKQELIMDQATVSETIQKTLVSNKSTEFWKNAFKDPEFAKAYATGMKKENEALLKRLMKDPDYQSMMLDILKDPEYQKEMQDLLKSKDFRKHIQTIIVETFDSPIFKAKIQDILMKAAQEISNNQNAQKQGGQTSCGGGGAQQGTGGANQGG